MKIKPTGTNVIIKVDVTGDKIGSLYIPVTSRSKSNKGKVLDIAPGTSEERMQIVTGDTVVFPKGQGTKLNEETILLKQNSIQLIESQRCTDE